MRMRVLAVCFSSVFSSVRPSSPKLQPIKKWISSGRLGERFIFSTLSAETPKVSYKLTSCRPWIGSSRLTVTRSRQKPLTSLFAGLNDPLVWPTPRQRDEPVAVSKGDLHGPEELLWYLDARAVPCSWLCFGRRPRNLASPRIRG